MQKLSYPLLSGAIRGLAIDAIEKAKSGHPGMPLGAADIVSVLFAKHIRFSPQNPQWPSRDRFVLSAGHGSMLLYSLFHLLGIKAYSLEALQNFRQFDSITPGHPEYGDCPGVEVTTGPLGQGIANAVGMALAERHLSAKLGRDVIDHHTYALVGDGCLMEGISQEAISFAGHHQLEKLIVLYDSNGISIDGSTDLAFSENVSKRFDAAGFSVQKVDGHNAEEIDHALETAKQQDAPSFILCRTTIGYGAPNKAGSCGVHGSPLGSEELTETKHALGLKNEPFYIDPQALALWREIGARGDAYAQNWQESLAQKSPTERDAIYDIFHSEAPKNLEDTIANLKQEYVRQQPSLATRAASRKVLDSLTTAVPSLIGGSADLSESNQTKPDHLISYTKNTPDGRYIHYGVREHAMVAMMSGMALSKGLIPYGGTFLVFADYARPALRLAALMQLRVIFVATHDSIGLGEDGPTHQPVEHLASLRAIPNLHVLRPCDIIEVAECWQIAIESPHTPTVLALSRQKTTFVRHNKDTRTNLSAKGGYLLSQHGKDDALQTVTIVATGSEVELAQKTAQILESKQCATRVVSMPCLDLFLTQPQSYQNEILRSDTIAVIEAGIAQGWQSIGCHKELFFGVENFGASAPAQDVFAHFGLSPEPIAGRILDVLSSRN